jgi:hypothetical protein
VEDQQITLVSSGEDPIITLVSSVKKPTNTAKISVLSEVNNPVDLPLCRTTLETGGKDVKTTLGASESLKITNPFQNAGDDPRIRQVFGDETLVWGVALNLSHSFRV